MEFLNDFLEQEAPRMKEFLHKISTRSTQPIAETVLDWAGYIDEGKQLAILHHLLSESIQKLPTNRQTELGSLLSILDVISKAKNSNNFTMNALQNQENNNSIINQQSSTMKQDGSNASKTIIKPLGNGERGIMRGVLTPSSLEKNIFRYNDPTVSPLLNQQHDNPLNQSQSSINGSIYSNPIQHSHSTSSISSVSNHNYQHHLIPTTVHHHHHHNHAPSPERYHYLQQQQQQTHKSNTYLESSSSTPRNFNTNSHYYTANGTLSGRKSPTLRASTLPRNNNVQNVTSNASGDTETEHPAKNMNLIQIGMDTSSAFVRKSPTPMIKATISSNNTNINNNNRNQKLNGSQLSLLSDRNSNIGTSNKNVLNLNLGIPHNSFIDRQQSARVTNQNSNMPMKLEDLDDLLKYADEHAAATDELKPSKGSNTSIGHCSSGYQSIATQSQSSTSPVDLAAGVTHASSNEYNNNSIKQTRRGLAQQPQSATNKYQSSKYGSNTNSIVANGIINPPLAFKNPLYQLQTVINGNNASLKNSASANITNANSFSGKNRRHQQHIYSQSHSRSSQKSSSLTPSSSDERLNAVNDKFGTVLDDTNGNSINGLLIQQSGNLNGTLTSSSGGASDREHSIGASGSTTGTLNGNGSARRLIGNSASRVPRTNPSMQVNSCMKLNLRQGSVIISPIYSTNERIQLNRSIIKAPHGIIIAISDALV